MNYESNRDFDTDRKNEFENKLNKLVNELKIINNKFSYVEKINNDYYEDYMEKQNIKSRIWDIFNSDNYLLFENDFYRLREKINSVLIYDTIIERENNIEFKNEINLRINRFLKEIN